MNTRSRFALLVGVLALSLGVDVSPQTPLPSVWSQGLQSTVTLDFRTVAVFVPALDSGDAVFQSLLSARAETSSPLVRVGRLDVNASVRVGTVELPRGPGPVSRFDLWLAGIHDPDDPDYGWSLVVASALGRQASGPADVLGVLRLAHQPRDMVNATLTGGIVATGHDGGRLLLSWGRHEWTTPVMFTTRGEGPRPRRDDGVVGNRTSGADTTALQRFTRLGWRNTVTVTLADGTALGTVYAKHLHVDDRDFAHLVSVARDAVVPLTAGAAIRLDTDVPLGFDGVILETGNVGTRSPGAYGVWLKRVHDGWRVVFNDEPDAWGTQHDPAFDVSDAALTYTQVGDSSRALSASVVMTAEDRGRFVLVWGPHEWTADFTVEADGANATISASPEPSRSRN